MADVANGNTNGEEAWRFKSIRWKLVFRRQDHASLLLTLALMVIVGVVSFVVEPRNRIFYIYDATISNPIGSKRDNFTPTVPDWAAMLIPFLMMLGTLSVGEFIYSRRQHHSVTDAVAVSIYFILDVLQSFMCTLVVVQATKVSVGFLRPDFLMRCRPIVDDANAITIAYGQDTTSLYPCTSTDEEAIKNGRQSFPSGHAAISFNLATYSSGYLIWCWHMRREWGPRRLGPKAEFLSDLSNVVAKLWMLLMLGLAWGIACSRVIDNQHSIGDIVAGMVIGFYVAVIYILRAIPRYVRVLTFACKPSEEAIVKGPEAV